MKSTKIFYWITTILFAGFMIFSSIAEIMQTKEGAEIITKLGYPAYFVPFIGWAKLFGSLAILVPGFDRLKEWAYAGLFFDLTGATYSGIVVYGFHPDILGMAPIFIVGIASYILSLKMRNAQRPKVALS